LCFIFSFKALRYQLPLLFGKSYPLPRPKFALHVIYGQLVPIIQSKRKSMSKIKDLMGLLFFMNDRKQPVIEKVFRKNKGQDGRAQVQKQNYTQRTDHQDSTSEFKKAKP
jgi:hypothetical protein